MASKKELVEGQAFSRRRLITAFVSGAPGGREVEPGKPLRAVVGGVVLSAIIVVGALAAGLLAPTLPDGWDQDSLVIAEDTGARYVALDGVLYPVINTASARLLIPSNFKVVSAKADKLTTSKRGPTLGIIGAPDALPTSASLVDTGWATCTSANTGMVTRLSRPPAATATTDQAVVATVGTDDNAEVFLVDNGFRYRIKPEDVVAVRRALGLQSAPDYTVTATWINLFAPAPDIDLDAFQVPDAGDSLAGVKGLPPNARIGSIISDSADTDTHYVLLSGGAVAELTPFAYALYRTGPAAGSPVTVQAPVLAGLGEVDTPVWPDAWPAVVPSQVEGTPCALLLAGTGGVKPQTQLGVSTLAPPADGTTSVVVDPGAGALVRGIGQASLDNGPVFLVDQTGAAFPIEVSGSDDPIAQLGFSLNDIVPVPQAWVALFSPGPTLSTAGARTVVSTVAGR